MADDGDAVGGHEQDGFAAEQRRDAVAFLVAIDGLVAFAVNDYAVVEEQVVVVREGELGFLEQGEGGEPAGVDVQDAGGVRVLQMNAGVNVQGDLAELASATEDPAIEVANDEGAGGEFLE